MGLRLDEAFSGLDAPELPSNQGSYRQNNRLGGAKTRRAHNKRIDAWSACRGELNAAAWRD